jgi:ZIP family zinc transporter
MVVLLITIATAVSTTLGGLFAIRFKDKLHLILGFSAGAVLGVTLFDLLPEAIALTKDSLPIQTLMLFVATGFSVYIFLDRFSLAHSHTDDDCKNPKHNSKFGALALTFHSFLDGFGIGLAFKVSPVIGWVVALAVLTHDFSDGINTVSMILRNKGERKSAIKWLIADALAPTFGVLATGLLAVSGSTLGLVLAIFVGFFLYISASDLIPESHHRHPEVWTTILTILGMTVIYLAIRLAS